MMRTVDITSTEVSALFGLSPYTTEFEVWHHKKNKTSAEFTENTRMKWGNRLESAIAQGIAEDMGWYVEPFKSYIRIPELRLGSSFDFGIYKDGNIATTYPSELLEIKNVDGLAFKNGWLTDDSGNIEAPAHIELQAQHQMLVSGLKTLYIGALVGGNEVTLIKRTASEEIQSAIAEKVDAFWESVERNEPPKPDFAKDYAFIKSIYSHAEPNSIVEPTPQIDDLVRRYKAVQTEVKQWSEKQDAIKAELLTLIGEAEKCKGEGYSISAGIVGETEISYTRKAYRNLRLFYSKGYE